MRGNKMKDLPVTFALPNVFIQRSGKSLLVPSMVLSTMSVLALITFVPQLMPLWVAWATGTQV
jgi:hypothetical protein